MSSKRLSEKHKKNSALEKREATQLRGQTEGLGGFRGNVPQGLENRLIPTKITKAQPSWRLKSEIEGKTYDAICKKRKGNLKC